MIETTSARNIKFYSIKGGVRGVLGEVKHVKRSEEGAGSEAERNESLSGLGGGELSWTHID
jgi:hypothetical protein